MANVRNRRSIRLKGFDYSQPADYFVTICTHDRRCVLGEITGMSFQPTEIGGIVEDCWKTIPTRFPNVRCGVFQVMPNHVHGIISIIQPTVSIRRGLSKQTSRDVACNVPTKSSAFFSAISPEPGSLGAIIRSFKSAATRTAHEMALLTGKTIWQSRYYDHIIRDDISYYYIERYIELNPVFWHLDAENPGGAYGDANLDALRNHLLHELHLDSAAVTYLIENEIEYRIWRRENERQAVHS